MSQTTPPPTEPIAEPPVSGANASHRPYETIVRAAFHDHPKAYLVLDAILGLLDFGRASSKAEKALEVASSPATGKFNTRNQTNLNKRSEVKLFGGKGAKRDRLPLLLGAAAVLVVTFIVQTLTTNHAGPTKELYTVQPGETTGDAAKRILAEVQKAPQSPGHEVTLNAIKMQLNMMKTVQKPEAATADPEK